MSCHPLVREGEARLRGQVIRFFVGEDRLEVEQVKAHLAPEALQPREEGRAP